MDLSSQIIKPQDCILAVCIPATKKSFVTNLNSGKNGDFTQRTLYRMYHLEFLKPAKGVIKAISKKGVTVLEDCTLNDFKNILQKEFKLIILFAHCIDNKVEFFDGLYDNNTVNDLLPVDKKFFFDLNVCYCDDLAMLVVATKMNVQVKYGQIRKTIPLKLILFYEYFFELIRQKQLTYFDAMQFTNSQFIKLFLYENK
jgi:hypothetical protein